MNPTKRKDIVPMVAEALGHSSEDVDNIIYYYYKHVASLIDSLEYERVYVYNIGIFISRYSKIIKTKQEYQTIIASLQRKNNPEAAQHYIDKITKLDKILESKLIIFNKQHLLKKEKYEPNRTVESERSDIRGN